MTSARRLELVGYTRVSTLGQVTDGQGLDIQSDAIRDWTRRQKHRLIGTFSDEGVSGSVEERVGLEDAIAAIRFNGADGLVIHTLDRLARSLTVQEAALQQVWAAGGRVFTVDGGEVFQDDPDDPARTLIRQVLGAVSQFEAAMIARRLRRGRERKAAAGGYAHGSPPLGWRADDGQLVPDPNEQQVVERIRSMWAEGSSLRQIGNHLDDEGLVPKRSTRWHPMKVKRVIDRSPIDTH